MRDSGRGGEGGWKCVVVNNEGAGAFGKTSPLKETLVIVRPHLSGVDLS